MGTQEEKTELDRIKDELDRQVYMAENNRRQMLERIEKAETGLIVQAIDRLSERMDAMDITIGRIAGKGD